MKPTRFLRDSGLDTVGQITSVVCGMATGIALARILGVESRGLYGMAVLLPQTVSALVGSGVSPAMAYAIAGGQIEQSRVPPVVLGLSVWLAAVTSVLALLLVPFCYVVPDFSEYGPTVVAIVCPLRLFSAAIQGVLLGQQAFRARLKYRILVSFTKLAVMSCWLLVSPTVQSAVIGFILSTLAEALIGYYFVHVSSGSIAPRIEWRLGRYRECLKFGAHSSLGNAIAFLAYRVDHYFVYYLCGPYAVGIYAISVGVCEKLWLLSAPLSTALFPRVAEQRDNADASNRTARIASMLLPLTLMAGLLAGVVAQLIPSVYGTEFTASVAVVRWLLPGIIMLGYARILTTFIAASGSPNRNTFSTAMGLGVNVAANLILIPRMGASGAALATTLSYGATTLIAYIQFIRMSGLPAGSALIPERRDVEAALVTVTSRFRLATPRVP